MICPDKGAVCAIRKADGAPACRPFCIHLLALGRAERPADDTVIIPPPKSTKADNLTVAFMLIMALLCGALGMRAYDDRYPCDTTPGCTSPFGVSK